MRTPASASYEEHDFGDRDLFARHDVQDEYDISDQESEPESVRSRRGNLHHQSRDSQHSPSWESECFEQGRHQPRHQAQRLLRRCKPQRAETPARTSLEPFRGGRPIASAWTPFPDGPREQQLSRTTNARRGPGHRPGPQRLATAHGGRGNASTTLGQETPTAAMVYPAPPIIAFMHCVRWRGCKEVCIYRILCAEAFCLDR